MENIVLWLVIVICVGVIFLGAGIFLGAFFGKVGSLEVLNFILSLPVFLVKSPGKLKASWKIWQELRALKRMDLIKRKNRIKSLRSEINSKREEIRKLRIQIKRLKWGG